VQSLFLLSTVFVIRKCYFNNFTIVVRLWNIKCIVESENFQWPRTPWFDLDVRARPPFDTLFMVLSIMFRAERIERIERYRECMRNIIAAAKMRTRKVDFCGWNGWKNRHCTNVVSSSMWHLSQVARCI